jgi:transketolase
MSAQAVANTREAATEAIFEAAQRDPKVVFVSADPVKAARATRIAEEMPDRLFECGISEQAAVAFAAGLATCGYKPFVMTYANFITMRACEQVRNYAGYTHLGIKFIGLNGGVHGGEREGVTHQSIEDLAILRAIPCMEIVVPADAGQVKKATLAMVDRPGPGYIRVGCGREPVVYDDSVGFEFGTPRVVCAHGSEAVVFAVGPVLTRARQAAELLGKDAIGVTVVDLHTIKPLNRDRVLQLIGPAKVVATVEDHTVIGGLGSAIAEVMAEAACGKPLVRIGMQDVFGQSGEGNALLDYYGMSAEAIADVVRSKLNSLES